MVFSRLLLTQDNIISIGTIAYVGDAQFDKLDIDILGMITNSFESLYRLGTWGDASLLGSLKEFWVKVGCIEYPQQSIQLEVVTSMQSELELLFKHIDELWSPDMTCLWGL